VVQALGYLIMACLSIAVVLGLSKHGEPIWKPARALLLPGGVLMMVQSTLLDGPRVHPIVAVPPSPDLALGLFTCGLGTAGLGLEHLDPARPWSLRRAGRPPGRSGPSAPACSRNALNTSPQGS
jgi:hypothetical protein